MKEYVRYREAITDARRVIVKVGSRVLVQKSGRPDRRCMAALIKDCAHIRRNGFEVVLVSSGAIGAGMEALGMTERPTRVPDLQMAAAIGQTRLMAQYSELFGNQGFQVGQMLLTHADFKHRVRLANARRTMENLLRHNVIPIINENDVVADEEIRADLTLGDNDLLAALVVKLIRADLLIMLTTVDGLREPTASGRSRRVPCLEAITRQTFQLVTSSGSTISKGGMASKLRAAEAVVKTGCLAVIANGRTAGVIPAIMRGEDVGTLILSSGL